MSNRTKLRDATVAVVVSLYRALKEGYKAGSAVDDLGCSIDEFKLHIEAQWQPEMSWSNHATDGWHIDHIVPLDSFDLTDPMQLKKACHYTNLQPLWWLANVQKSNK